jgi:dienelactone hydrolase/uncharacterized protein YndB with AHSA1/START domain
MAVLKRLLYFFIFLLIAAVAGGYLLLPSRSHVERSAQINAPPETVYGLLHDFSRFKEWSPWAGLDPNAEYRYEGPESGLGAKMFWSSANPQVGSGSQEIIEALPYTKIGVALDFGEMGRAASGYNLEPSEGGTRVTWSFDTEHGSNLLKRVFGMFMDKWLGGTYEVGLNNLKELAESRPAAGESSFVTKERVYDVDGTHLTGFLAFDRRRPQSPGVLIVHEWWGHNDYARRRAKMLAELGYTAFALDMYGDGKLARHPEDATKFMNEVVQNAELTRKRFLAALALLKSQPSVNPEKIAAVGYCFGGGVVLNMARMGVDLDGVVSFHGSLEPMRPVAPGTVKAELLVLNGAADPFVTEEQKKAFKQEMEAAGVTYEFVDYPGVKHSFTNPGATETGREFGLPLEYNAEADADSWQRMQAFLTRVFR